MLLIFLETFKRGKEKCSQALMMSDINTDSDVEKINSNKKSSVIGPFPPIVFDDAAGSSCNNNGETKKSDLNTSTHINISRKKSSFLQKRTIYH